MENGLPVITEEPEKSVSLSDFIITQPYRKIRICSLIICIIMTLGFLIWGIIVSEIAIILLGLFMSLYILVESIIRPYFTVKFCIDNHFVTVLSKIKRVYRSFSWQEISSIKVATLILGGYPIECFQEYLIFTVGDTELEDSFFIHAINKKNVICIPKTDETVSFVEQFRAIEKESK